MKKTVQATRFEILCTRGSWGGRWYFHLRSRNGQISLQSEMYPSKAHARRAIARLIKVISAQPPIAVIEEEQ